MAKKKRRQSYKDKLFEIYGRAQAGDQVAIDYIASEHHKWWPKSSLSLDKSKNNRWKQDLHTMYLQLTRG